METKSPVEQAAEEYADERCREIQKRREAGLPPYSIREAIILDYLKACRFVLEKCREKAACDKCGAPATAPESDKCLGHMDVAFDDIEALFEKGEA